MANIFDYLSWRADVPLSVDPFNEVDNLVLSKLAYTDFEGAVPPDGDGISLREAHDRFFAHHTREEILRSTVLTAKAPLLMEEMRDGARFGEMRLCRYLNEVDREKNEQIAAVTFLPEDGSVCVAFRGTDNTLTGWKEDFDLSYLARTPGQQRAVDYLNETGRRFSGPIRVCGHSKGGNFAVYAASFCDREIQDRIEAVYTNDGPGFRRETVGDPRYRRVLPRVYSILPDTSVIGRLLYNDCRNRVVRSSAAGIYQHDGFSWEVRRNRFVKAPPSEMGIFIDRTLDLWLIKMNDEERRSFTETVFALLEATGKETFSEITEKKLKSMETIASSLRDIPKERQRELIRFIGELLQCSRRSAAAQLKMIRPAKTDRAAGPQDPK